MRLHPPSSSPWPDGSQLVGPDLARIRVSVGQPTSVFNLNPSWTGTLV
jgi:hypothetical protein